MFYGIQQCHTDILNSVIDEFKTIEDLRAYLSDSIEPLLYVPHGPTNSCTPALTGTIDNSNFTTDNTGTAYYCMPERMGVQLDGSVDYTDHIFKTVSRGAYYCSKADNLAYYLLTYGKKVK